MTIQQDLKEIREDISEIKQDLREHMTRTKHNETRIEFMENFAQKALEAQQENFKDMLKSNKSHQDAQNRQLKIVIGIFAALATLVTAVGTWVARSDTHVSVPQPQVEVIK